MNRTALTTIAPEIFRKRLLIEGFFDVEITEDTLLDYFRQITSALGLRGGPPGYSARNVIDGSTRAARHAGTQQATAETPSSSMVTPRYVTGSTWETSKSSVTRARLAAAAAPSPTTTPSTVSVIPWRTTS